MDKKNDLWSALSYKTHYIFTIRPNLEVKKPQKKNYCRAYNSKFNFLKHLVTLNLNLCRI